MGDQQKYIKHMLDGSAEDFEVAEWLFNEKIKYDQALFFCHLSIEKILKSIISKQTGEPAPYIHNLKRLAEIAGLDLSAEQTENLVAITGFNISGRYSEFKEEFYKKASKEFAQKWFKICKDTRQWLVQNYL